MSTPSFLLLALQLTVASATPLAARNNDTDESSASRAIERLGGGGPGGQSAVRGFFIGIALGVLLALLCCCWYPCVHMRRADRRAAARRILRAARVRREMVQNGTLTEAAPADTQTGGNATTGLTTAAAAGRPLAAQ
ncbi:hypothetical protein PWT90_09060 [Aphanocladium album]|nr:hypothetical protein PWT90_09060 [Aphanocladium album]